MGSGQVDAKEAAKVGAKEATKEAAKEATKVGAKEDAKPGLSEEAEQLEMAEFSWDEQGFGLLSSLDSDMAANIDEKIRWVVRCKKRF